MKINSILLFLLATVAAGICACNKKGNESEPDYSNYNLSLINYRAGSHSYPHERSFEYDKLNRLTKVNDEFSYYTLSYRKNSITRFNGDSIVYKTDDNGRIISDIQYTRKDSTHYEYDGEGYLINKGVYRDYNGYKIWQDLKYTYQNGNMVMAVTSYYDLRTIYTGADTLTFSYNSSLWYPEAVYLSLVPDLLTGKPNKNNVSDIYVKTYALSPNISFYNYDEIHYTYTEIGKRLGKVSMNYTLNWGNNMRDTIDIDFSYKPKN